MTTTQNEKRLELWFLCISRRLLLIDIYMNFYEDILNGFQQSGQDFVMVKVKR